MDFNPCNGLRSSAASSYDPASSNSSSSTVQQQRTLCSHSQSSAHNMHSGLTCGSHAHKPCMRQQHASLHTLQPVLQTPASSSCRPCQHPFQNSPAQAQTLSTRSNSIIVRAEPDRGSIAALEAAIGAINGILGAHSKSRQQKQKQQGAGPGQQGSAAAAKPTPGPSKLISFSAKASGSVPVKVRAAGVHMLGLGPS